MCERVLVTMVRWLGPWKNGVYLAGGLVPRYLVQGAPAHIGTQDVDLVLDLELFADLEAYATLEQNLKRLGFERSTNPEGKAQHFRWERSLDGLLVQVDLLCAGEPGGRVRPLDGERRLSALMIPGAHLVLRDYLSLPITAELLDERGMATVTVRFANVVPFLVLKALAYEDRGEPKDAYDLIYCLIHAGPEAVADQFAQRQQDWSEEPLLNRSLEILRSRFASEPELPGEQKDGPHSYSSFLTSLAGSQAEPRHRQDAVSAVEIFLARLSYHTNSKKE